jgi:hypothetical protein
MFNCINFSAPHDDVLRLFEYAKSLLDLHQDKGVEFWRNIDETALEVWVREDHADKSKLLDSRDTLTDLRELLSRHLAKMRCAAEWVHRIIEVSGNSHLKPDGNYRPPFWSLCHDYPALIRDCYRHEDLPHSILTLMDRWYLPLPSSDAAGVKQFLQHTLIKTSDSEPLARFLKEPWLAGNRFYVDRDLLQPIIGNATNERKVLIIPRLKEWQESPHALTSANATPVIEKGMSTGRLVETFSDGLLRLSILGSSEYLELVRSRIAVLYLLDTGALFVEYPWHRFGSGQRRLDQLYAIASGQLPVEGAQYPVEPRDEMEVALNWIGERITELPKWNTDTLKTPADSISKF